MDHQRRSLRVGACAVLLALMLRLGGSMAGPLISWLSQPNIQSFLIYLETGRHVRFSPSSGEFAELVGESPAPMAAARERVTFTAEDARALEIRYGCSYTPDIQSLLLQPLGWNLTGAEPTVLIIHTHTTESYTKAAGETYTESAAFRTLDENYNMLSVGEELARLLEAGGIRVIHDRELYDYPSYNGSYSRARSAIQEWLETYPSICMVLDLHRDASGDLNNQLRTALTLNGESCAQLMLVMGTDAAGLYHPNWQENLSLGLKLQAVLEDLAPGITRPLTLRSSRFNQDLTAGSLLIEVGAAGNTHAEAMLSMTYLAQAILRLAQGSN